MEQQYLKFVLQLIDKKLETLSQNIEQSAKQVEHLLGFISDAYKEMDEQEIATQQTLLENEDEKLFVFQQAQEKLQKQRAKPYFARFDFVQNGQTQPQKVYVGMANLTKDGVEFPIVCDWRAPISSIYYDFELGKANYQSEQGIVEGEVVLKRQFKIENGQLIFYFDSSFVVMDDILQQTLAQNTSTQMRSIIATIQKEQNAIIRNQKNSSLLVQGYAGSGKSAIAMHRVAFLLYRNKNLSSNQVMIISPNKMFSYYIGGVLPELGEKNILETTFLTLAKQHLGNLDFETREQMVDALLLDKQRMAEAQYKEDFEFFENLKTYLNNFANTCFKPKDIVVGKDKISKEQIAKLYFENYKQKAPALRVQWIADFVVDQLGIRVDFVQAVTQRIVKILYGMFVTSDILLIYQQFLAAVGLSPLQNKIGYEDLAPLLFVKDFLFGLPADMSIKHLVIDEMQDFSPIHFEIFEKLFPCQKTILGDIYQGLFKKPSKDYLTHLAKQLSCEIIELKKCYRSTTQITNFAAKTLGIADIETVSRNGGEVICEQVGQDEWQSVVENQILTYLNKKLRVAVICPTQKHAQQTFVMLSGLNSVALVDEYTEHDESDVLVMSVAFSKGLEFDAVVVLDELPHSPVRNQLLYIACSRALHELAVYSKK